ncbi:MAG: MATE family efflux transporter [Fusobacterium sp.]|nr:MATE family efflux transporter [Fusobacterium sp.]
MSKSISLGKDSVGKLFLNFSIPAVTGMIVTALYAIVDGVFVGRGVGAEGLAALNLGYPIINFGAALSLMFGIGGATLISLNPKDKEYCNRCFSYIIILNITAYLLIGLGVVLFDEKLIYLMGANEKLMPMVKNYMYPCTFALGFLMISNSLNAVVRNDKSPTYAFFSMVIGAVTNIFLDWLFIMKFSWGIFGAAAATGIGQLASMLFLIHYFMRPNSRFKFYFENRIKFETLKKIFNIGFPSFIMEFAIALITILFNISFMKYSGEMGVSAFCIAGYVFYIFRMLYNGLGQGIQPIVSYNYGEKKFDRVEATYKIGHKVAFGLAVIILIWVNFFGDTIINMFSEDKTLVKMAWHGLSLYSSAIIFVGANFIDISFLQSKDKATAANILSVLRSTIFVVLGLMILPPFLGENGVWLAFPFSDIMTFLCGILLKRKGDLF